MTFSIVRKNPGETVWVEDSRSIQTFDRAVELYSNTRSRYPLSSVRIIDNATRRVAGEYVAPDKVELYNTDIEVSPESAAIAKGIIDKAFPTDEPIAFVPSGDVSRFDGYIDVIYYADGSEAIKLTVTPEGAVTSFGLGS